MHLYAPMVEAKMRKMVREYPNLEKFVTNFRSKHLGVPTVYVCVTTVFVCVFVCVSASASASVSVCVRVRARVCVWVCVWVWVSVCGCV